MLDWLIVGGGIHGTYFSHVVTSRAGVSRDRVRVLDPHHVALAEWRMRAHNTGMRFLRSPSWHHLGPEEYDLDRFARSPDGEPHHRFANVWHPSLALFNAHAEWLIHHHRLAAMRVPGKAAGLAVCARGIRVETTSGALEARRVLLALGPGEPRWPVWAQTLHATGAPVTHVFDPRFNRESLPPWSNAIVIGGGITAVQLALALARRAPGTVTLLSRHGLRERDYDAHPCWFGWCVNSYFYDGDYVQRRSVIQRARNRGSVPPNVALEYRDAVACGLLATRTGEVAAAAVTPTGRVVLTLTGETDALQADRVVLATGFRPERPGGAWLTRAIADLGLACAACGYPIVDQSLRWHPGIYVTGALAELEIGPTAMNIIGARLAAERIDLAG
jgi:thioredoxin reductase